MVEATAPGRRARSAWAGWGVAALAIAYGVLNFAYPSAEVVYVGALAIAAAGVCLTRFDGISWSTYSLRPVKPTRSGGLVCAGILTWLPLSAIVGRFGTADLIVVLLWAPMSAFAQEIFFRGSLLASLERSGASRASAWLQALAFGAFHARAFRVVDPLSSVTLIVATFAAGLIWAVEVRRDRTLLYAILTHAAVLAGR